MAVKYIFNNKQKKFLQSFETGGPQPNVKGSSVTWKWDAGEE
jgi:hypothetical protein